MDDGVGIALPSDISFPEADDADEMVSKPVTDAVTLEYYSEEPTFSLFVTQMDDNVTQADMVNGDECMTESDAANLYRSKQAVINGGCFGDLDDSFDAVEIEGTVDDLQPESFQPFIVAGDKNKVMLKRFMGSKQCEVCANNRCVAENYTLPINTCYKWESATGEGADFFVVVSRTDPFPDISFTIYEDTKCGKVFKTPLTGGGADICIGAKKPTPEGGYDEGFEFRQYMPVGDDAKPLVDTYDVTRWIRGTDCREGFRSAFMGSARKETVQVAMNKCVKWDTQGGRSFSVKATLGSR